MDYIFVGTELFEVKVPDEFRTPGAETSNRAVMSPKTGEIWARWVFDGADGWICRYKPAQGEEPFNRLNVPGSLIEDTEAEIPDFFPDSLLIREFFLHVDYYRRQNEQEKRRRG